MIRNILTALSAVLMLATACTEKPVETVEYLDVNANNISGG